MTTDNPNAHTPLPSNRPARPAPSRHIARRKRRARLLNLAGVAITGAISAGALLWLFGFVFYVVGSNSMAPALLSTPEVQDNVLCSRLTYRFRQPRRWEIAIFETPATGAEAAAAAPDQIAGDAGMTIKRIVGLENENLAIAGGDIWTRPVGEARHTRQVKPDTVQRGMWIGVYREDFADLSTEEFLRFWEGAGEVAVRGGALAMAAGSRLRYLPQAPVGERNRRALRELPGIPDRYLFRQRVFFACRSCGTAFDAVIDNQKVAGRCPTCRYLNDEEAATHYESRSGLPELGPFGAPGTRQGDFRHFRNHTYAWVSDLKVSFEARLAGGASGIRVDLAGEDRVASVVLKSGAAALNDRPLELGARHLRAGEWTRVEFYVVDGAVRLFLGADRAPIFDRVLWFGERRDRNFHGWKSGIALAAVDGDVEIRDLAIDRDVHYYGGDDLDIPGFLAAMSDQGDIDIGPGRFLPLGDNTPASLDGRSWGGLDMSRLHGTALWIWEPEDRRGPIPSP